MLITHCYAQYWRFKKFYFITEWRMLCNLYNGISSRVTGFLHNPDQRAPPHSPKYRRDNVF